MTDVTVPVDLRDPTVTGTDVAASGFLLCVPTLRRKVSTHVTLPASFKVTLVNGQATLVLAETTTEWCWHIVERMNGGQRGGRYVAVTGPGPVNYGDLVDVDPATLDPLAPLPPVWKTYVDAADSLLQTHIDTNTSAISTNATAISNEVTARGNAITSEVTARNTAITTAIDAVTTNDIIATSTAGALTRGKWTRVDATSGPLTMTLANAAAARQVTIVEKSDASVNAVTVTLGLRGSAGSLTLDSQFQTFVLVADDDLNWYVQATHRTKTSIDTSVDGTRLGNRISVIGDSTTRGVYNGDSEPGIVDSGTITAFLAQESWLTWAVSLSGGQIVRGRNAGVTGNTLTDMLARVNTDIINFTPKASACIVYSGYNDAASSVTLAAFMTTYDTIVKRLRAAGIAPIAATPLPTVNNATIAGLLIQYALGIRKYALDNHLPLLDFQAWATDSSNGGLIAAVGTGGDGVHPGAAGQKYLGQKVATALAPLLPAAASVSQISPLDTKNLAPNGLFAGGTLIGTGLAGAASTDLITKTAHGLGTQQVIVSASTIGGLPNGTYFVVNGSTNTFKLSLTNGGTAVDLTADGTCTINLALPTSSFQYATKPANVNHTFVTDALVPGQMFRSQHIGSVAIDQVAERISTGWTAGDVIEVSGVITTSGIQANVQPEFNAAPFNQKAIVYRQDVTRGTYNCRITIPTGFPSYIDMIMSSGPGTGTADFGQLTTRNLTTLGLL